MIIIIDFGSQTTHLIGRRIRELGIDAEIVEPEDALETIEETSRLRSKDRVEGIILSGGPASVYAANSPTLDKAVFDLGIPILGICYGQQLMAHLLKGDVKPGKVREYGPATLNVIATPRHPEEPVDEGSQDKSRDSSTSLRNDSELFKDTANEFSVWMSHGDEVLAPPEGFEIIAKTKTIPVAAMKNTAKKIYGIQFHPEVIHTQFGEQILENFLKLCGLSPKRKELDSEFVDSLIKDIKDSINSEKAICALSGGVDSSVAALLVHKAIGPNLTAVYIDSGLMREGETDLLRQTFKDHYHMNVDIVDAKDEFLKALKGVTDPEEKRKAIGKTFIEVFEKEAKKVNASFLVQGTIYPDVIESKGSKHAEKIKSHHNVGGLPEEMNLTLLEPLRQFYKDEVRKIGELLGLPKQITIRHPFPGPGLAVRIIGEVTESNLEILIKADAIVREEFEKANLLEKLWQVFAVFTGIKTTGVRGDQRVYGETIAIRAIEAKDAMSADFAKLDWNLLSKISNRIVTEVKEVNRVVYDITTKPPATMEWE